LNWKQGDPFITEPVGEIVELSDPRFKKTGAPKDLFYIVIDRTVIQDHEQDRLADSLAQAYHASLKYNAELAAGQAVLLTTDGRRLLLSDENSCSVCGHKFPPITSAMFSFNSPVGACTTCNGFGNVLNVDERKVIPNPKLSLNQGAITPFAMPSGVAEKKALKIFAKKYGIDMDAPWSDLPSNHRQLVWEGRDKFWGVKGLFEYLETKKYKMHVRVFLSRFKSQFLCPTCQGTRLKPEANHVFVHHKTLPQLCALTIDDLASWMKDLRLTPQLEVVCAEPLRQTRSRLQFLQNVGLGYLTVDRSARTLSGGEFQRMILANQLGMGLSQTLYVLDEPTVGLHPRDNDRLITILKSLRELGNTLVIVEHDYDVIRNATHIIEMGPGSGQLGGKVIVSGTVEDFWQSENSNTVPYLKANTRWTPLRETRPVSIDEYKYILKLKGCTGNNLKNIDVNFPLNRLVTVTGVSGSGKSTLVTDTLYPAVARELGVEFESAQPYKDLKGCEFVKNVVLIDQSSIGKTARSSPVTYLKIYDAIRALMAGTPEAQTMGFTAGTFSLNVDGGRCPVCKGLGHELVDMMFMDDIEILCDTCNGKRFRSEVLTVTYNGKNINDILHMTVSQAMDFFVSQPNIRRPLALLKEVGLEYLQIGQSANSLSGGESQRLKIARELLETQQKATLYIMDEPTTGLHFREVHLLLKVLNNLIEAGGSVILIEHNLEVIKASDFIIDIGPEAGERGGHVVTFGSPAEILENSTSHTAHYLKEYLEGSLQSPQDGRTQRSHRKPLHSGIES
jgi:excinuclease ABC subunit A